MADTSPPVAYTILVEATVTYAIHVNAAEAREYESVGEHVQAINTDAWEMDMAKTAESVDGWLQVARLRHGGRDMGLVPTPRGWAAWCVGGRRVEGSTLAEAVDHALEGEGSDHG